MISVLFIGIALMFLLLAIASYRHKLYLEKKYPEAIKQINRNMKHEKKGAENFGSETSYFYEKINYNFYLEFAGFLIAAFAAFLECLSAIG